MENAYPYLSYDAKGESRYDAAYIKQAVCRMLQFFREKKYKYILFNFRHNMRNVKAAQIVGPLLKEEGLISDFAILPTPEQYKTGQRERFHLSGFKMFPELYPAMLQPVIEQVRLWSQHTERA